MFHCFLFCGKAKLNIFFKYLWLIIIVYYAFKKIIVYHKKIQIISSKHGSQFWPVHILQFVSIFVLNQGKDYHFIHSHLPKQEHMELASGDLALLSFILFFCLKIVNLYLSIHYYV